MRSSSGGAAPAADNGGLAHAQVAVLGVVLGAVFGERPDHVLADALLGRFERFGPALVRLPLGLADPRLGQPRAEAAGDIAEHPLAAFAESLGEPADRLGEGRADRPAEEPADAAVECLLAALALAPVLRVHRRAGGGIDRIGGAADGRLDQHFLAHAQGLGTDAEPLLLGDAGNAADQFLAAGGRLCRHAGAAHRRSGVSAESSRCCLHEGHHQVAFDLGAGIAVAADGGRHRDADQAGARGDQDRPPDRRRTAERHEGGNRRGDHHQGHHHAGRRAVDRLLVALGVEA